MCSSSVEHTRNPYSLQSSSIASRSSATICGSVDLVGSSDDASPSAPLTRPEGRKGPARICASCSHLKRSDSSSARSYGSAPEVKGLNLRLAFASPAISSYLSFMEVSDITNALVWPAAFAASADFSRYSLATSSASEKGDEMYSNSENAFGLGLYGAPSVTFQSSAGCRLSRIFWKRLRLTCPGLMVWGIAESEVKFPTRNACVIRSDSAFEKVGRTTEKLGSA
mmetsp:Transcript_33309/g.87675  ORF Transcript_33309/g.87675 Transcript_33309/m.87675 type:complete len:225 (+) Transcript_33309:666-1340(+)